MRRGKPGHVDAFRVGGSAELRMGNGGLIPGLVEEYSLIRRVLRGAYLRVHRIAVSPAVCLQGDPSACGKGYVASVKTHTEVILRRN